MLLEIVSLFLLGESWENGETLYSVNSTLCHMYRNNYRNNSLAYSSIEVLSVFFFALNKALHSVIQFSRLTGAKKKGLSVFSPAWG